MAPLTWRPLLDGRAVSAQASAIGALLPLAAGYLLSYLLRNVNSLVAGDIMRDLGVGADALSLLTSIYFLTFASAQIPVGILLDRYGPARVQFVLMACVAVGAGLCAAPAGFAGLLLGRALIGLGTAGGLVAGLKASAAWFPREQLAIVNGIFMMCGGLGALAATWPVQAVLMVTDWRGLFAISAVLACATALSVRAFVPRQHQGAVSGNAGVGMREILREPRFWRFAPVSAACFGSVLAVHGLWVGPILSDADGLSRAEVANDLACMAAVLIVATPCWGVLARWLRPRIPLPTAVAAASAALISIELLIVVRTGWSPVLLWCLFALFGGMSVLNFGAVADTFETAAIGRANGALNTLHIGCAFIVQLAIGQVVALWPSTEGRYPVQAYQAGLLIPLALQAASLAWFLYASRYGQGASPRPGTSSASCRNSSRVIGVSRHSP